MKPFEQQTYYELLEIPVTAPEAEILAAYERAIETYAPDSVAVYTLVDPGQVDALRARLTEAMEILTEPDLRAEYDRMIGVNSARASAVVTLTPALAAAAQAGQPEKASVPPAAAAASVSPPAAAPVAPSTSASTSVASEAPAASVSSGGTAPTAASEPVAHAVAPAAATTSTPEAASTPAEPPSAPVQKGPEVEPPSVVPAAALPVAPGQVVLPGGVTPNQIHAAFRSYAISYVPVLVPAPSLSAGSAFFSPFSPPGQTDAPVPAQEAPREAKAAATSTPSSAPAPEAVVPQAPTPASEPASPSASIAAAATEPAPRSVSATAPAPGTSAESTPASSAPAVPSATETSQATPVQAAAEPARSPEPAPTPAPAEPPARAASAHEEEELSGARAPVPTREEARAAAARGGASPSFQPGRPGRSSATPPPLPHGGRRITRSTPTVQPGGAAGEAGKGSARPAAAAGMNLEEAQQIAQESAIATAEAALAQVAAKAREPRPKPVELPPNTEFNGELLRRVRESRNLSLPQLAERTRISSKHLENVEADRYAALPATVYLRGILMNVARELGLDPLRVSRSYLALAADPKKK